jgi:hypothetical protein
MIAVAFVGLIYASASGPPSISEPAVRQSQTVNCRDWRECQQQALDAAARRDYETFHDLAWRTVQLGPRQDPMLMFLLARAQSLSGRPHDALVMLRRISSSGVAGEALTSDDFQRTRDLPDWPEVEALIEGTAPAPAATPRPAARVAASPATPSPPVREAPASKPTAAAIKPDAVDQSVHLTAGRFAAGGLAYDFVSHRFVVGDLHGRKLMVVSDGADHAVDLVRAESAGFQDIKAVEIDGRRGDLWVASATGDEWTIHRMQLISGRPLKAISVSASEPLNLADLAVTPSGTVLAIDSAAGRLLMLRPNASSLELAVQLKVQAATSVAATNDEDIAYVAHQTGIVRVDRRTKAVASVSAASGIQFGRIERLRWHRNALIAVQIADDGSRRVVRFDLNRSGRTVVAAIDLDTTIPAAAGPTFATVTGDELSYLVVDAEHPPTEFIIRRLRLP